MGFLTGSLLTRLFAPVGIVFIIMGAALVTYFSSVVRDNAVAAALPSAVDTVQQYKTIRGYYTKNVVKKVLAGSDMRAHFNHKGDASKIPLPATFIHDLSEVFSKQGMTLKLYSQYPFPNRASRRLDDFGQKAWQQLNAEPQQTFSRVETIEGREVLRVAVADTMSAPGCVACHNAHPDTPKADWKLGDVRGVLEVQVPIDQQLAAGNALNLKLSGFLIAALIFSVLILMVAFRRLVSKRLEQVSGALSDIADGEGNLGQRLAIGADDEVGAIAKAFNRFVEHLEVSLREVGGQVGQLVATSQSLSGVTERFQQGAVRQQQETDQVAAAMNELTATSQEVARMAATTAESTQRTQTDAESGREVVSANMRSVEKLSQEMQQAAEVVARLDADSQNIGSVLDVIRGIAEQTNLLALNAAIEAARAGEQGRGFAVVADEVRTLASRTQASTEEIQQMIEQLQTGAKNAVSTIEQGSVSLQSSLDQASKTSEVIETIAAATNTIRDLNTQIATAAEEQTSVSDEINQNVSNIAEVAESNTHDAQQLLGSVADIGYTIESVNKQLQRFTGDQ